MERTTALFERLEKMLPTSLSQELREQMVAVIAAHLTEMNVVTRDQFDVQKQVLAKTRQKLELLEQRLAELESEV